MTHPFAVDRHLHIGVDAEVRDLWDVADTLHVRRVAARTEDDSDTRLGVNVVRCDEGARGITCQRDDFSRHRLIAICPSARNAGDSEDK